MKINLSCVISAAFIPNGIVTIIATEENIVAVFTTSTKYGTPSNPFEASVVSSMNKIPICDVPFGKYDKPTCPSEEMMNFRMYFLSKQLVRFTSLSFEDSSLYEDLESGDVVYFDPPYVPASETANFTSYATDGFTSDQQVELAQLAESLASKGIRVIVSNHDVPITRELYKNATIYPIQVTRTIAAKGGSRKKASELIAVY